MRAAAQEPGRPLRRGWTTGACATAAAKAAATALFTGAFPDPVEIALPKGERPAFALNRQHLGTGEAMAAIVKDAGDDPDVTHLAEIVATVRLGVAGSGVVFRAGAGVGTVTLAGLPIPPGEPAINPVPRRMIGEVLAEVAQLHGVPDDFEVTLGVTDGVRLAEKTWNPRLGIVGGLSILGTTGIVHPFSCSAWIHSIHRGIDVARAAGLSHAIAATGSTSEALARSLYPGLPDIACLDMGDFAGGLLKYLRVHPLPRLTLAGGFAKLAKLSAGSLDLHSGRSQVDLDHLAALARQAAPSRAEAAAPAILAANTGKQAYEIALAAGIDLGAAVAERALATVRDVLREAPVAAEVLVADREGRLIGRAG